MKGKKEVTNGEKSIYIMYKSFFYDLFLKKRISTLDNTNTHRVKFHTKSEIILCNNTSNQLHIILSDNINVH